MISLMRRSLQSNAYRFFLWAFLVFMVIGGFSIVDFDGSKDWVIKVYKQPFSDHDWRRSLASAKKQMEYFKQHGINWEKNESVESEVLRRVLTDLLLRHSAVDLNLNIPESISEDNIAERLKSLPGHFFNERGELDIHMFERAIAPSSFDQFLDEIETNAKSELIHNLVDLSSYVPRFELVMQYNEDYANKEYSVLTFSLQKSLAKAKEKAVSDSVLEKFYKKSEHGNIYKTAEQRSATYWKFSEKDYDIKISDKEIKSEYEKNKRHKYVLSPAQIQVKRVVFGIDNGKSQEAREKAEKMQSEVAKDTSKFAEIASKLSADKASLVTYETVEFDKDSKKYDKILITTAFEKLSKDGDVSSVVKTKKGYEIVQRVSRKSTKYKALKDVKQSIESELLSAKFKQRFQQSASRVASNARYDQASLKSFVEKRHGKKASLDLGAKSAGILSLKLFETDKGRFAIFMDGKDGVLLRCDDVVKSSLKPFKEVKDTVLGDYYRMKAKEDLSTIVAKAMKESSKDSFDAIAKKYNAHLEVAAFKYSDGEIDQSPVLHRYDVGQKVKLLQTAGEMIDVLSSSEALLIRLDSIAPINEKLFEEKESSMASVLSSKVKYQGRDSFIASLYRNAKLDSKIEIKEELLNSIKEASL